MLVVALWLRLWVKKVARRNGAAAAQNELGHSTVEIFRSPHPHLASIGASLDRSMKRHVIDNDEVRSAFADLVFELDLAQKQLDLTPSALSSLLEPTT